MGARAGARRARAGGGRRGGSRDEERRRAGGARASALPLLLRDGGRNRKGGTFNSRSGRNARLWSTRDASPPGTTPPPHHVHSQPGVLGQVMPIPFRPAPATCAQAKRRPTQLPPSQRARSTCSPGSTPLRHTSATGPSGPRGCRWGTPRTAAAGTHRRGRRTDSWGEGGVRLSFCFVCVHAGCSREGERRSGTLRRENG